MKTLKSLTLFTVLLVLSACSTSGNNGGTGGNGDGGGGGSSIKQQLQGTWNDTKLFMSDVKFLDDTFTSSMGSDPANGTYDGDVVLSNGEKAAMYHMISAGVPGGAYIAFYIKNEKVSLVTQNTKEDVLTTKEEHFHKDAMTRK